MCIRDRYGEKNDEDDHLEVSDVLPSQKELDKAGNVLIYDANGVARPFKSLYQGVEHEGSRQMVIFVRHFYCGVSLESDFQLVVSRLTLIRHVNTTLKPSQKPSHHLSTSHCLPLQQYPSSAAVDPT